MQSDYAAPTMAFAALAALSIALDWFGHRRTKRTADERPVPGLIPWALIGLLSLIVMAFFAAAWLRDG